MTQEPISKLPVAAQRVAAEARHAPRQNDGHRQMLACTSHFAAMSTLLTACLALCSCGQKNSPHKPHERVLNVTTGGRINSLDPAFAADLVSSRMVAALYDTLLQYNYLKRPYSIEPSMLKSMPENHDSGLEYRFELRDDLFFTHDKCFGTNPDGSFKNRRVTAKDVEFSLLRVADGKVLSPGYWLLRDKISGINNFRNLSAISPQGDFSAYNKGCEGIKVIDDFNFVIRLSQADPRFLYGLAMPYMGIVPREAVEAYGQDFSEKPVGSGPFILKSWHRNYCIEFERNQTFRKELFIHAENPDDRSRKLPLLDRVVASQIDQPLSAWLLFLQGNIDLSSLDKDNLDAVVTKDLRLIPALQQRGIQMLRIPQFQIYYIGFCFTDPLIATNLELRKAISSAYNVQRRVQAFNHSVMPAQGPVPPGASGNNPEFINPYSAFNLEKAKLHLAAAGFPDGINPSTGETLELSFDLGGNSSQHRQIAEMFAEDMSKIGIRIRPVLNNWPRFLQKSAAGQMQLFKLSWVGDYPDAENFLQLFYGPNIGSCNRSHYKNPQFDQMFEEIKTMPESPQRTAKYEKMVAFLAEECPWIFAYYPISFSLRHSWIENYHPHDFVLSKWKYISVDNNNKNSTIASFKPLSMRQLRDE
ncbi:MAG: hypothetical protein JW808_06335 [Victivallales bacterium]|nr:hypothetical protein [Victivallales bacterium]